MEINSAFKQFRLYAVTDFKTAKQPSLDQLEAVCRGGADILQLRSKCLNDNELLRLGHKVKNIVKRYNTLLFVNDRLDLALALEADGLHLGQDDLPVVEARKIMNRMGKRLFIGLSTHSVEQAQKACTEDIDYFGVGPVFATPTKEHYQPVGLELVRRVSEFATKPFVCIGGIHRDNLNSVLEAGAKRVAMVRALFQSEDIYGEARNIRNRIEKYSYARI